MPNDAKTGQPIFGRYSVGLHNVGSYQVSGIPWITGSEFTAGLKEHEISFPMVTKSVTVIASGSYDDATVLRVAFNSSSAGDVFSKGKHYITLEDGDSVTFNTKCAKIYIRTGGGSSNHGGYELIAELTGIPTGSMSSGYLTGSGFTDGPGPPDATGPGLIEYSYR